MILEITNKNIIGDIYFLDFLEKKSKDEILIAQFEEELLYNRPFKKLLINGQDYFLFNCGINCFVNAVVKSLEKINYENIQSNNDIIGNYFTGIRIKMKNDCFYVTDSNNYDLFVLVERGEELNYVREFIKLSKFIFCPDTDGNFELIKPGVIYPGSISIYSPKISRILSEGLESKKTTKNISFSVLTILIAYGENMKIDLFKNEDVIFLQKENIIVEIYQLEIQNEYLDICRKFYETEYHDYLSFTFSLKMGYKNSSKENRICGKNCSCCSIYQKVFNRAFRKGNPIIFKLGDNFYSKGQVEFCEIENSLRKNMSLMSFCDIFNFEPSGEEDKILIEINSSFLTQENIKLISQTITDEEALKNAQKLIEEEEIQRIKSPKKNKRREKEKEKKFQDKLKKLAKKISIDVISNYSNFKNDKKLMAKKLAEEAIKFTFNEQTDLISDIVQFDNNSELNEEFDEDYFDEEHIEKSIEKILDDDDDSYCKFGSNEYYRRKAEWDITKIIPNIYCFPKEYIISLFNNH